MSHISTLVYEYDHCCLSSQTHFVICCWSFQLAVAKANYVGGTLDTVIIQDLVSGSGCTLEVGDSVELMYTGWLLIDATFGLMFDSNANAEKLLRFKLGKGKVIKVRHLNKNLYTPPPQSGPSDTASSRTIVKHLFLF